MTGRLGRRTQYVGVLLQLPPRRWLGMLRVAVLATYVEWRLWRRGLPQLAARLGVSLAPPPDAAPGTSPWTVRERERIDDVRRVIRHRPFNGTCLRQALLIGHQLRRRHPNVVLGVRKEDGEVFAHAWLVVDGIIIDDFRPVGGSAPGFIVMPMDLDQAARLTGTDR